MRAASMAWTVYGINMIVPRKRLPHILIAQSINALCMNHNKGLPLTFYFVIMNFLAIDEHILLHIHTLHNRPSQLTISCCNSFLVSFFLSYCKINCTTAVM